MIDLSEWRSTARPGRDFVAAEVHVLLDEIERLRDALNSSNDCEEHADNCCENWCIGCRIGVSGRDKRRKAIGR